MRSTTVTRRKKIKPPNPYGVVVTHHVGAGRTAAATLESALGAALNLLNEDRSTVNAILDVLAGDTQDVDLRTPRWHTDHAPVGYR